MSKTEISLASLAVSCASALIEEKGHADKAKASREAANSAAMQLHKAKAKVGRYNKCAIATAFVDTLTAGGLAKKTAQNYLSLFKTAVESGKPIADLGGTKKAGGRKNGKGKGQAAFADLLLKAFNHDEGKTLQALCEKIQGDYDDALIQDFYGGVISFLESEGFEITK